MRRQNGLALIMALLLVAAAAVLALSAANRSRDVAAGQIIDGASVTAQAAADGGVERARWALARDVSYTGESLRIGRCDVEIQVERGSDGELQVLSIARAPAAPFAETVTERVSATLRQTESGLPSVSTWRE